jgi:hypothetical protein
VVKSQDIHIFDQNNILQYEVFVPTGNLVQKNSVKMLKVNQANTKVLKTQEDEAYRSRYPISLLPSMDNLPNDLKHIYKSPEKSWIAK